MTRLNTPHELGKLKSDVTPQKTEEQRYVTNIIPDAEVETTDTAYEDWLAAKGLLGLKSSPAAEVDPKILTRQTSLNTLHWSLDVIYKFIKVNEFSCVEKEEVELKLSEILDLLKSKVEPQKTPICKIADEGDSKTDEEKTKCEESLKKEERKTEGEVQKVEEKEDRSVTHKTEEKETKCDESVKTEEKKNEELKNAEKKEETSVIHKNEEKETKYDESVNKEERKNEEPMNVEKKEKTSVIHKKEVCKKEKKEKIDSIKIDETKMKH